MRFGFCSSLKEISQVEKAGFDYIEPPVGDLMNEKEIQNLNISSSKIKPEAFNCFLPSQLKIVGKRVDEDKIKSYLKVAIGRVASLGGKVIVFGSGGARGIPDNFSREEAHKQIKHFLNLAADEAKKEEIIIVIEPLASGHCNIINKVAEGLNLAKEVNREEVKLLADLRHMQEGKEDFSPLILAKEYLFHIHLCDFDGKTQVYPGKGTWNIAGFFKALKSIGYDNRVSIEHCDFSKFAQEGREALRFLREIAQETKIGVSDESLTLGKGN